MELVWLIKFLFKLVIDSNVFGIELEFLIKLFIKLVLDSKVF